ncbi:MAG: DUF1049 domain-containing protein [Deltaproteobacteria bacterium]|nr:DUF1049 domain-containing protein [Deltaproteobacteria bacterium]
MSYLYWLIFLMVIGIAIFAIQNSSASPVVIKFLLWKWETSLIYTILGSFLLGILLSLLFWMSRRIRDVFPKGKEPSALPQEGALGGLADQGKSISNKTKSS